MIVPVLIVCSVNAVVGAPGPPIDSTLFLPLLNSVTSDKH